MNEIFGDLVIVIIVLAAWLALVALLVRGWRNRGRRQVESVGELPSTPSDFGAEILGPDSGLYLGSTFAPSWQNRVAVGDFGDRASTRLSAFAAGIRFARTGASEIWIPRESITAIRTERGHAGKVMGGAGVLVIRWTLPGGTEIDSGFRADDKAVYPAWIAEFQPATETSMSAEHSAPVGPETHQQSDPQQQSDPEQRNDQ